MNRRSFLSTGLALVAAPAIVKAEWLMPVKKVQVLPPAWMMCPDGHRVLSMRHITSIRDEMEDRGMSEAFYPFPNGQTVRISSYYSGHSAEKIRELTSEFEMPESVRRRLDREGSA